MTLISKVQYKIDKKCSPVAVVNPGELFTLKVQNAFGKSFATIDEFETYLANDEDKKNTTTPVLDLLRLEQIKMRFR